NITPSCSGCFLSPRGSHGANSICLTNHGNFSAQTSQKMSRRHQCEELAYWLPALSKCLHADAHMCYFLPPQCALFLERCVQVFRCRRFGPHDAHLCGYLHRWVVYSVPIIGQHRLLLELQSVMLLLSVHDGKS